MTNLEINLPNFAGFYNSNLDVNEFSCCDIMDDDNVGSIAQEEYDSIDWKATYNKIASLYLDKFTEQNKEDLQAFGIILTFLKVDSPREYNFGTDKLVCVASFEEETLKGKIIESLKDTDNQNKLIEIINERFEPREGFIPFYSNDIGVWFDE